MTQGTRGGWKKDGLTLLEREWWCGVWGVLNDWDGNAARNLANWPGLRFPVTGRGDRVRPGILAVAYEASRESGDEIWTPLYLEYQISTVSE